MLANRGRRPQARDPDRRQHPRSAEARGLGRQTVTSGRCVHCECDLDGRTDHGQDRQQVAGCEVNYIW